MSTSKHEFHPLSLAAALVAANKPSGAVVDFDAKKEPSLTVQSEKDNCDLNVILKRMEKAGPDAFVDTIDALMASAHAAQYGDASNIGDFKSVQDNVANVKSEFSLLPADIRSKFQNDPVVLLEFLSNPENAADAAKMGLLRAAEAVPAPAEPSIAPTGAEGGAAAVAPAAAPQPAG